MIFIVEWIETSRRRCYVEAESPEAIHADWNDNSGDSFVDYGIEVDRGIDRDSLDIGDTTVSSPDVTIGPTKDEAYP